VGTPGLTTVRANRRLLGVGVDSRIRAARHPERHAVSQRRVVANQLAESAVSQPGLKRNVVSVLAFEASYVVAEDGFHVL